MSVSAYVICMSQHGVGGVPEELVFNYVVNTIAPFLSWGTSTVRVSDQNQHVQIWLGAGIFGQTTIQRSSIFIPVYGSHENSPKMDVVLTHIRNHLARQEPSFIREETAYLI